MTCLLRFIFTSSSSPLFYSMKGESIFPRDIPFGINRRNISNSRTNQEMGFIGPNSSFCPDFHGPGGHLLHINSTLRSATLKRGRSAVTKLPFRFLPFGVQPALPRKASKYYSARSWLRVLGIQKLQYITLFIFLRFYLTL